MLDQPIKSLIRTTPAHVKKLEKMGIFSGRDLLSYFPRALEDAGIRQRFSEIILEEKNTLGGELHSFRVEKTRYGKNIAKAQLSLSDGEIEVVWFSIPYHMRNFEGSRYAFLVGKVKRNYGKIQISNPEIHFEQNIHVGSVRPVYPESPPITSKWLREKISGLLSMVTDFPEVVPLEILETENLMKKTEAIKKIHFPTAVEDWQAARKRLGFEEIFEIQVRVMQAKILRQKTEKSYYQIPFEPEILKEDFEKLPFELTNHQKKSLAEILQDFEKDRPMHRLLQGDVGSGKTVVAFLAALQVVRAGFQVAILAPTEILAQQHLEGALKFFNAYSDLKPTESNQLFPDEENSAGTYCEILTGSVTAKQKKEIKERLRTGFIKVIIGTHAILTEDTIFKNLGFAVIDEQHRFGVAQRAILANNFSHTLAMTATPIPRSLALTIYGDQDLSIIAEKPAGRKPIVTRVIGDEGFRKKMEYFIEDQISKDRQVFWVCPLVDESDAIEARNVKAEYDRIAQIAFPKRRVTFLHGKMRPKEKEEIMASFKNKEFDILVSTSVIEVGVDIPDATVMVIENAERFGLSQLHQFRGRIGRNDMQSYCFLMVDKKEDKNKERLRAMEKSNDGFYLSEVDLKLRGAGEIYGRRQSGLPDLKCADLNDVDTMKNARDWADKILQSDLELNTHLDLKNRVESELIYF